MFYFCELSSARHCATGSDPFSANRSFTHRKPRWPVPVLTSLATRANDVAREQYWIIAKKRAAVYALFPAETDATNR